MVLFARPCRELRVEGGVAAGFGPVADVFRENFSRRGELGAGFCVYRDGVRVVDLWGGHADPVRERPWDRDTLATLFSATKGLAATALLMLADRGQLEYDAPVARYWPAFAAAGKGEIRVRTLLNHRAGLLAFPETLRIEDFEREPERVRRALEHARPLWSPGEDQGYHGVTFGAYASELVRRISGQSLGAFLRDEIALPLGLDLHLGLDARHERRVAEVVPSSSYDRVFRILPKVVSGRGLEGRVLRRALDPRSDAMQAFRSPSDLGPTGLARFNTRRVRRLELAWSNGIGTAAGLAKLYAALAGDGSVDGVRLVSAASLAPLLTRQSWSDCDRVIGKPLGWSQGFIKEEDHYFSPHAESFGHPGAGGTLGFADPIARLGIGYVMNKMAPYIRSPRVVALCDALYDCLDT